MSQLAFDLAYRAASGREDFLIAPSNADALAWIDRWPDWPSGRMAIQGPPDCGKSHLIAVWREVSAARLLQPQDLSVEAVPALVADATGLALDDADAVAGLPEREAALFHLINLAAESGLSLLFAAREAPNRWPLALPDLRSRLAATGCVAIERPDDDLMAGLLVKLFLDRQTPLDPEAVTYLVARMERSFSAAHRVVVALDRVALAERRRVTVPVARRVLQEQGML
ncbi:MULTISPECIES: DnaA/Hda family protein [Limibacillus]|uniref:Chromosomal replication initiation ATPase DnaA n=1 Tax=Limibacillus halophilus TaxID=1579333 RepID=A0A839SRV3_9PROT|nr:DnaA/Hda family protein [Limibacillus halophilus]MBB3065038.1 chromosomal replication initiation ATPase DnaA [Limibacillus halophilus]